MKRDALKLKNDIDYPAFGPGFDKFVDRVFKTLDIPRAILGTVEPMDLFNELGGKEQGENSTAGDLLNSLDLSKENLCAVLKILKLSKLFGDKTIQKLLKETIGFEFTGIFGDIKEHDEAHNVLADIALLWMFCLSIFKMLSMLSKYTCCFCCTCCCVSTRTRLICTMIYLFALEMMMFYMAPGYTKAFWIIPDFYFAVILPIVFFLLHGFKSSKDQYNDYAGCCGHCCQCCGSPNEDEMMQEYRYDDNRNVEVVVEH